MLPQCLIMVQPQRNLVEYKYHENWTTLQKSPLSRSSRIQENPDPEVFHSFPAQSKKYPPSRQQNRIWPADDGKTTSAAARQMVSHGHITVDGIIVNVPSYSVSIGETLSIRPGSRQKVLFSKLEENLEHMTRPNWLSVDLGKKEIRIESTPDVTPEELLFNVQSVLEFYTR